jgi:hypothetical protein
MLYNIIDYVAFPKGSVKLDASKINSMKKLLNDINLSYRTDSDDHIFVNNSLEIDISKNGSIIISLSVPPEKTEKGIIILGNICKNIYSNIFNNIDELTIEVSILENADILIEKILGMNFNSKHEVSITFETSPGSKIIINKYYEKRVIFFLNYSSIEDIRRAYFSIKQGFMDGSPTIKSSMIVRN